MRDPQVHDADIEAAIGHAMRLLAPFVHKRLLGVRDPPFRQWRERLNLIDDGRRRTFNAWIEYEKGLQLPPVRHPPGHPRLSFRRRVFILVLEELATRGYRRRRNQDNHGRSDKRHSGCSILSMALARYGIHVSEAQIVDLIRPQRRRKKRPA